MRIKVSVLAALSGLSLAVISTPAMAGGCGYGAPANCGVGINVIPNQAPSFGPMTIRNDNPMGHLRTIDFQRAPNVSITRVHGMAPSASIGDAPSGFTNGCHPTSTKYCRANAAQPISVQMNAPMAPTPIVSAPIMAAPTQQLRTWTGKGYDPAKFQPRQYGENTFTPGIAHIPTSIVDRSPVNAQAMLNSGRTVPQPVVSASNYNFATASMVTLPGTMAPSASYSGNNYTSGGMGGFMNAPQPSAPMAVGNGVYGSNVAADGSYWEKTSGVTMMGSTVAIQVICKRQLPRRIVNPVVGFPVAVPTPVAVSAPVCRPAAQFGAPHAPHAGHHSNNSQARYGAAQGSRWAY